MTILKLLLIRIEKNKCLLDFICLAVLKAAGAGAANALFN
jgi:hypothetical protein